MLRSSIFAIYLLMSMLNLMTSCSPSPKKEVSTATTFRIKQEALKKEQQLFADFVVNLEQTLFRDTDFVQTNYKQGWQLVDKRGKYLIRSMRNFSKHPQKPLLRYEIQVITLDNPWTNPVEKEKVISIPVKLSRGRESTVDLDFPYHKTKFSRFEETTHFFEFAEGIIVNYRTMFNDDCTFTWDEQGLHKWTLDLQGNNNQSRVTLWKKP